MAGTAIFDLDRTVTRAPTWTRFLIFVGGRRPGFWLRMTAVAGVAAGWRLGLAGRDRIKAEALKTLRGIDRATIEACAAAFVARELATNIRPGARAAIARHRARGDRLILATAAAELIADPLAAALGFDEVIATRLDWAAGSGPRLDGANCYGTEKLRRIAEARALRPFAAPVHAYSDHLSDLDMLRAADHGFAVNPSSGLARAAPVHGIAIVDFEALPQPVPDPTEQPS